MQLPPQVYLAEDHSSNVKFYKKDLFTDFIYTPIWWTGIDFYTFSMI